MASTPVQPVGSGSASASNRKRDGTDRELRPYFARSKAHVIVSEVMARVIPT
jgi:hypothetical protein